MELLLLLIILALLGSVIARGCLVAIIWFVILAVIFVLFLTLLIQGTVEDGGDRPDKPRTTVVRTI
ncbi:MAG: hypothetical protein M3N59_02655 [bacterium]|nr:hypothetical protein [bacterium]